MYDFKTQKNEILQMTLQCIKEHIEIMFFWCNADRDTSLAELRQTPHTLRDIDSRIYLSCSQESYLSLAIEIALVGQSFVVLLVAVRSLVFPGWIARLDVGCWTVNSTVQEHSESTHILNNCQAFPHPKFVPPGRMMVKISRSVAGFIRFTLASCVYLRQCGKNH